MTPELQTLIADIVPKHEGWCPVEKAQMMADLILTTRPSIVVELGVFGGRSLIPQALALKQNQHGKIYGIDPWKNEPCLEGETDAAAIEYWKKINLHDILKGASESVWTHGLDDYVVLLRCRSQDVASLFSNIDLLHIDACHSEIASCRDVETWLPKLNKNGFLTMDDCDWPSTQKAVKMVESRCKLVQSYGNYRLFCNVET